MAKKHQIRDSVSVPGIVPVASGKFTREKDTNEKVCFRQCGVSSKYTPFPMSVSTGGVPGAFANALKVAVSTTH